MSPRVRFLPSERSVVVEPGTTLLDAVHRAGLPIASACGADGLCARCGVMIVEGDEGVAPEGDAETSAKRRNRIPSEERLACRVVPRADVTIRASYW